MLLADGEGTSPACRCALPTFSRETRRGGFDQNDEHAIREMKSDPAFANIVDERGSQKRRIVVALCLQCAQHVKAMLLLTASHSLEQPQQLRRENLRGKGGIYRPRPGK